jgi:hypothetical protein
MVNPRNDARLGGGSVDEAARVASLWRQLRSGMQVRNPQIATIILHGILPEKNVPTAMQLWEQTRATVAINPAAVADDLVVLTNLLTNYYVKRGERAKVRALWETALEASHTPAHMQYIRASLCRAAVNDGDDNAAAGWLAPCNPQPADLMSDTAYRASYAYLLTAQGQFDGVVQALGDRPDVLPFFSTLLPLCGVLRANAIEKRGDVSTAVAQLKAFIAADRNYAINLPTIVHAHPRLALCPQSLPLAFNKSV